MDYTEGQMRLNFSDRPSLTLICGPDGWRCPGEPRVGRLMNGAFPLPATEAGTPFVIAFNEARDSIGIAEVIQEPDGGAYPPIPMPI